MFSLQKGDRVFTVRTTSGAYAQYATSKEATTFHLHPRMTFEQGASIGQPYACAYRALFKKYEDVGDSDICLVSFCGRSIQQNVEFSLCEVPSGRIWFHSNYPGNQMQMAESQVLIEIELWCLVHK